MPPAALVMLASIFIASIVATTPPGSTVSPSATVGRDDPGEGGRHVRAVGRVGLLGGLDVGRDRAVADLDGPELPVERAHDGAHPLAVGVADGGDAEQQALAGLDLGLVLAALLEPVEELDGPEHREVAVALAAVLELARRAGEEQLVEGAPRVGAQRLLLLGGQLGGARSRLAPLEGLGAERLGPAAGRVAELALEEADDGVGDVVLRRVGLEVGRVGAGADEGEREVADDLRGRRHLDDVAEDRLAAAYMSSMSSKRSPRPRAMACWRRLDSWPPGISWK